MMGVVVTLATLLTSVVCQTQKAVLTVTSESYTRYPSLEPVNAIYVSFASPAAVYDLINRAIGDDPDHPRWDCTKPSSYRVAVVIKKGGCFSDVRSLEIAGVVLEPHGKGLTSCEAKLANGVNGVNLILKSKVSTNDLLQVSLVGLSGGLSAQSDGTLTSTKGITSFSATPQAAPSEALTNGKTRDVGQLSVSFSDSNLFASPHAPFNTYVKSTDLFSTDEKDSKSSFTGTLGIQRGVFPRWYTPVHLEQMVQGNQIASNLSTVTTLGMTTLLPWAWSSKLLYNKVIQVPLPPDLTLDNQYTHRINQLITPKTKLLATDDYALNPFASWSSIRFPWACTVFGRMNITAKKAGDTSNKSTTNYCLGVEMDLGTYYLPLDLTAAKNQRVEGYGDVSILIPLSGLSFAWRYSRI